MSLAKILSSLGWLILSSTTVTVVGYYGYMLMYEMIHGKRKIHVISIKADPAVVEEAKSGN